MKQLIILHGVMGSGKSTFIKEHQLEPYTLSLDSLRHMYGATEMSESGRIVTSQANFKRVLNAFHDMLEVRMSEFNFTVIDATHLDRKSISGYLKLAEKYHYDLIGVDITGNLSLDELLVRNKHRVEFDQVPESVVIDAFEKKKKFKWPKEITVVSKEGFKEAILDNQYQDLSHYSKIHHIGDIHGCIEPLSEVLSDFKEDEAYIFVGDYIDRGIDNAEVLLKMMELINKPNVTCIRGNHELHTHYFADLHKTVSKEFEFNTLPELLRAGIGKHQMREFFSKLQDFLLYRYHGKEVLVTHGGMPKIPDSLAKIPSRQFYKGVGRYGTDVSAEFEKSTQSHQYQVHGHRNSQCREMDAKQRSFNLESKVEFGGHLSVVTLDKSGWSPKMIKNNKYKHAKELDRTKLTVPWIEETDLGNSRMSDEFISQLREHDLVMEKSFGHISAFNFTRDAFFSGSFDEVNTQARGLFVNNQTNEVVARGYKKFFNINERGIKGASLNEINDSFKPPLQVFIKENGFLGLIGYDSQKDHVFISSKGNPEGDHAGYLRDLVIRQFNIAQFSELKRYLRDQEACMVVEAIDMENDPHIIGYDKSKLVLLDVLRRSEELEIMPYQQLKEFSEHFGIECKDKFHTFESMKDFSTWFAKASVEDLKYKGNFVEGMVVVDAEQNMTKVKLPHYNFFKACRSIKDRVLKIRGTNKPLKRNLDIYPGLRDFAHWAMKQSDELLEKSIIEVKEAFMKDCPDVNLYKKEVTLEISEGVSL